MSTLLVGIVLGTALGFVWGRWERQGRVHRAYVVGFEHAAEHFDEERAYGYEEGHRDALQAERARRNGAVV